MRKSDCVMIFICAVFLFFSLGAIGRGGREQAKILACAASEKQIAGIISSYQNDNDGCVPVMLHKFSITQVAAKAALMSLPFRHYSGKPVVLPPVPGSDWLNPDKAWDMGQVMDYYQNYLQKFYVCPFVRGSSEASWWRNSEVVKIGGICPLTNYKSDGLNDSYSTWIWPRGKGYMFEDACVRAPNHPYGPEYGKNKYGNLQWHAGGNPQLTGIYPDTPAGYDKIKNRPVKFSNLHGLSELTAAYCAQGELDESSHGRVLNYGSHKRGGKGGTNVIFGDMHVEWIAGAQITAGN
jgi:hypothetical protein